MRAFHSVTEMEPPLTRGGDNLSVKSISIDLEIVSMRHSLQAMGSRRVDDLRTRYVFEGCLPGLQGVEALPERLWDHDCYQK